jgi:hypothetical protein
VNKFQIPNAKFQTNSNDQLINIAHTRPVWTLAIKNCLRFDAWNLEFSAYKPYTIGKH